MAGCNLETRNLFIQRLETSLSLQNINDELLQKGMAEIFEILGGIRQVTYKIIHHCSNTNQLNRIKQVFSTLLHSETLNKEKKATCTFIEKTENKRRFLGCELKLNALPKQLISIICSFLDNNQLDRLKNVSLKMSIVCLNESNKWNINIMNGNELILFKYDKIKFNIAADLKLKRVDPKSTYHDLMTIFETNYKIPSNQQLIYEYYKENEINEYCYGDSEISKLQIDDYDLSLKINTGECQNFIMFDKRIVGEIGNMNNKSQDEHFVILKYFDISLQKVYIVDIILTRQQTLQYAEIINYIKTKLVNKFINEAWCINLFNYISNFNKILVYQQDIRGKKVQKLNMSDSKFYNYIDDFDTLCTPINSQNKLSLLITTPRNDIYFHEEHETVIIFQIDPNSKDIVNYKDYIYNYFFVPQFSFSVLSDELDGDENRTKMLIPSHDIKQLNDIQINDVKCCDCLSAIQCKLSEKLNIKPQCIQLFNEYRRLRSNIKIKDLVSFKAKFDGNQTAHTYTDFYFDVVEEYDVIRAQQLNYSFNYRNYTFFDVFIIPPNVDVGPYFQFNKSPSINLRLLYLQQFKIKDFMDHIFNLLTKKDSKLNNYALSKMDIQKYPNQISFDIHENVGYQKYKKRKLLDIFEFSLDYKDKDMYTYFRKIFVIQLFDNDYNQETHIPFQINFVKKIENRFEQVNKKRFPIRFNVNKLWSLKHILMDQLASISKRRTVNSNDKWFWINNNKINEIDINDDLFIPFDCIKQLSGILHVYISSTKS